MSILFVGNFASDFGGIAYDAVTTRARDANYSPSEVVFDITQNAAYPFNIFLPEVSKVWCHFRFYSPAAMGGSLADGYWVNFRDASGDVVAIIDLLDGQIRAQAVGTTTETGAAYTMNSTQLYTIDFMVDTSTSNIVVEIYVNGTLQSTATATKNGQSGIAHYNFEQDDMSGTTGTVYAVYSEFIIAEESTLGKRMAVLTPAGQGAESGWIGDFNNVQNFDDGRFIQSKAANERESFTLSAYNGPATPSSLYAVVVKSYVAAGESGPTKFKNFLRIGGTNYDGAQITPNNLGQLTEWLLDPSTSAAWDTATFASMEFGLKSET